MQVSHQFYWELFPAVDHEEPITRGGDPGDERNLVTTSQLGFPRSRRRLLLKDGRIICKLAEIYSRLPESDQDQHVVEKLAYIERRRG